ncbi:hypothetical protein HDU83_009202 [Entophlyctis luteolus]|nr:hypothetical protein HDU83_009202 [Entophlyctis luteolus]
MPGIWVYNFVQLFIFLTTVIANSISRKISEIIQSSLCATNLMRGTITLPEISDFWIKGRRSPAHKIVQTSARLELIANLIVVACSIAFSWEDVKTTVLEGYCQPPVYANVTLPLGINISSYISGSISLAEVYNYGLPLSNGLVGGWPGATGWPLNNPMNAFWMEGIGPIYVIELLCDNGTPTSIDYDAFRNSSKRMPTIVQSTLHESDEKTFLFETQITFPPGSVYDDIRHYLVNNSSFIQTCTSLITASSGFITFSFQSDQWNMVTNGQMRQIRSMDDSFVTSFPDSMNQYTSEAHSSFATFNDSFGVSSLIKEALREVLEDAIYYPSHDSVYCNFLSEGTLQDGYYHTSKTYQGFSMAIGAVSHFALMQYKPGIAVACDYIGFNGSGRLTIPYLAVLFPVCGVIAAFVVKLFEILWWTMSQTANPTELAFAYQRARRSVRHPFRFAIDASEMLATGMATAVTDCDVCDLDTTRAIEELGSARIIYGEDSNQLYDDFGHLRIGEYGKVKNMTQTQKYGTLKPEALAQLDELTLGYPPLIPQLSEVDRKELALITCKTLIKKVPFLERNLNDGRDDLFYDMVASCLFERIFQPGTTIVEQGAEGDEMYFLLTGKVNVILNGSVVASLADGSFFGEMAIVARVPRSATIVAARYCSIYCLTASDFRTIVDQFEDMKIKIDETVSDRTRKLEDARKDQEKKGLVSKSIRRLSTLFGLMARKK